MASAHSDGCISSFPLWRPFSSLSYLTAVARTPNSRLNGSGEWPSLSRSQSGSFHHWVWGWLWAQHTWPLSCWGVLPLYPLSGECFKSWMDVEFCQKLFPPSVEEDMWFLFFSLLAWCITLIDFGVLNHLCVPGINATSSRCMILLMLVEFGLLLFCWWLIICVHQWCWFIIFCVQCLCLVLISGLRWPRNVSLEAFLPLQLFGIVWEG